MLPDEVSVTAAEELYLLAIERLSHEEERATTKEIATFLGINQSTVTEHLKRLAEKEVIDYEWRAGAVLTTLGEDVVRVMLRRQRLLKTFMVKKLDYDLAEVYHESLAMQHMLSSRFTDALDQFLNFPKVDPHGEVIPSPGLDGAPAHSSRSYIPLTEIADGQTVRVCYLPDWRSAQLNYLYEVGVVPDASMRVLRVPPANEPILLELQGKTIAISSEIARFVGVCPCDKAV